ncbi:MAG: MBL fold metallo-hydrolase [Gemmatimonadetes bacterium]|nr:MAG: MBL fold metallo-hydrolase [Gemmatimonadota bacterium]
MERMDAPTAHIPSPAGDSMTESAPVPSAAAAPSLVARCWGTRGSIPSPGPLTARYGGNTPCLEVRAGGHHLVFDAGTGIRALGEKLVSEPSRGPLVVFLTHFHWDHIQGFPFFRPLYDPEACIEILGPTQMGVDVQTLFAGQMGPIYFPIPFEALAATKQFEHLDEDTWERDGVRVRAMRVRHPSYTLGYRVEAGGRALVFVPDNELVGGDYEELGEGFADRLADFAAGADVLIHDSMFTEAEYAAHQGWGHSTFDQALALAHAADVGTLLFYHHAPQRTDDQLDAIVAEMRARADALGFAGRVAAAAEGADLVIPEARP